MNYNKEYLDIKYALIDAFMIKAAADTLDVSYKVEERKIYIQVILLDGSLCSEDLKSKVRNNLPEFEIEFRILHISKEKFNETRGEWEPKYYTWYDHLLLSKAEVL